MNLYVLIFVLLASVGFFNYHGILTDVMQKFVFYSSVVLAFAYSYLNPGEKHSFSYPSKAYLIILTSFVISIVVASTTHLQSFKITTITTLSYLLSYGCFLLYIKLDVPNDKIIKAMIWLFAMSSFVYFCNAATFPNTIFGQPLKGEDLTRGIVRIPVVFIEMLPLLLFYAINQWLINKEGRLKWICLAGGVTLMIVLSVTRQIIAVSAILAVIFLFRHLSWKLKALMAVCVVGIVIYILPLIPIYNTMLELTEEQKDDNEDEEDIRIQSWRYYTYEDQTNIVTTLFGNGMPALGKSIWGTKFFSEAEDSGRFAEDVGWAGFYYYFGIFGVLALLYFLYKAASVPKPQDQQYISYWAVFIMITSIASAPILYSNQVVMVMLGCYMAFNSNSQSLAIKSAQPSSDDSKPSYLPRYEQL